MAIDFKRIFDNAHIPVRTDVNKFWVNVNYDKRIFLIFIYCNITKGCRTAILQPF